MRLAAPLFAGILLSTAAIVSAKDAPRTEDLSGQWSVTWLANNSVNPLSLSQSGRVVSGTYVNDSQESCKAAGRFDNKLRLLTLTIQCPAWDIQCDGLLTRDSKLIVGRYLAYGTASGGFQMSRK